MRLSGARAVCRRLPASQPQVASSAEPVRPGGLPEVEGGEDVALHPQELVRVRGRVRARAHLVRVRGRVRAIGRTWCGLGVGLGLGRTSSLLYAWSEMYTQSLHL